MHTYMYMYMHDSKVKIYIYIYIYVKDINMYSMIEKHSKAKIWLQ